MNSRAGDDAVERFRADGMDLGSAEIDWIAGLNASVQIERRDTLHDEDGIQLSDHPLLAAGVKF